MKSIQNVPAHLRGNWRSPLLTLLIGCDRTAQCVNDEFMWQEILTDVSQKPIVRTGKVDVTDEARAVRALIERAVPGRQATVSSSSMLLCGKDLLRGAMKNKVRIVQNARERFGFDVFEVKSGEWPIYLVYEPMELKPGGGILFDMNMVRLRFLGHEAPKPFYGKTFSPVGIQVMASPIVVTADVLARWMEVEDLRVREYPEVAR